MLFHSHSKNPGPSEIELHLYKWKHCRWLCRESEAVV